MATSTSPKKAAAIAAQIKRVYLELARRYHPDLAKNDDDRAKRQEIMLKVNQAFHERDLDTLVAIKRDADAADGPNGLPSVAARLAWSLRELDRLDDVIADLNTELATIRASESGRLWRSFAAGEPVFDRLAVDLRTELNRQRTRLADLTDIQNAISARAKRAARRALDRGQGQVMTPERPFRFGLTTSSAGSKREWTDKARKLEALGYSTITVPDHFPDRLATVPALMAAADATRPFVLRAGSSATTSATPPCSTRRRPPSTCSPTAGSSSASGRGGSSPSTR